MWVVTVILVVALIFCILGVLAPFFVTLPQFQTEDELDEKVRNHEARHLTDEEWKQS